MWINAEHLYKFYSSPLGIKVATAINSILEAVWVPHKNATVLGVGFAQPFLEPFQDRVNRLMVFMPAPQGAVAWPYNRDNATTLIEETLWPLADQSVDHLLIVHCLEFSADKENVLKEAWRVLKPQGELIVMVPNRLGMWAHSTLTPFGYGTPYAVSQLSDTLTTASFKIKKVHQGLFMLPSNKPFFLKKFLWLEKIVRTLSNRMGGVIICQAVKEVYGLVSPPKLTWSAKIFRPVAIKNA